MRMFPRALSIVRPRAWFCFWWSGVEWREEFRRKREEKERVRFFFFLVSFLSSSLSSPLFSLSSPKNSYHIPPVELKLLDQGRVPEHGNQLVDRQAISQRLERLGPVLRQSVVHVEAHRGDAPHVEGAVAEDAAADVQRGSRGKRAEDGEPFVVEVEGGEGGVGGGDGGGGRVFSFFCRCCCCCLCCCRRCC